MTTFFRFCAASDDRYAHAVHDTVVAKGGVILRVEGGDRWPDIMGCTQSAQIFVSERVVLALNQLCSSSFFARAISRLQVSEGDARVSEAPTYYSLSVKGGVILDLQKSGLSDMQIDPETGKVLKGNLLASKFVVDESAWTGDFLCVSRVPLLQHHILCTFEIIELARKDHWTNARFYPSDMSPFRANQQGAIDYLQEEWPPASLSKASNSNIADVRRTLKEYLTLKADGARGSSRHIEQLWKQMVDAGEAVCAIVEDEYDHLSNSDRLIASRIIGQMAKSGVAISDALWDRLLREFPNEMKVYQMFRR